MKIAIFTDTYHPQLNGVVTSIDNFVKELRSMGHTVYIFAPKFGDQAIKEKDVFRIPSLKLFSDGANMDMRLPVPLPNGGTKKLFSLDFDIVHAHGNGAFSLMGYQVARMKNIPYVLTFHTFYTKYTHYFLKGRIVKPNMVAAGLRIFANLCDVVITPAEKMRRELILYGAKKPIKVVPNFVDYSQYTSSQTDYLRKRFRLPKNAFVLVSVGRLGKEKNFPFLINVLANLVKKLPNAHLVIVGPGPEKKNLQDQASELGVSSHAHFTGKLNIEEMPAVYSSADVFVFSSQSEVHPMVALEAASAGLPFIVGEDEAFKNIIINEVNGFMLPLKRNEFVKKIVLLYENADLRKKFGKKSREVVKQNFDGPTLTRQLLDVYKYSLDNYQPREETIKTFNRAATARLHKMVDVIDRFFDL